MREFTEEEVRGEGSMVEKIQEKPAEKTKKERPAAGANHRYANFQTEIPKEKGVRAWLTRNAVAFCTVFIGFFSVLHISTWVAVGHLTEFFAVPLACVLISIPLILIRTDHWIMGLAGWFGVLCGPFIILLELVGITSQNGIDGNFFTYLVSVYFLDTVILGVMARKGAVRNRLVVPRWEQKIRAWATRNTVAICIAFIAAFLLVYFFYWNFYGIKIKIDSYDLGFALSLGAAVLLLLVSIPLILSGRGGSLISLAGWMGVFWLPYSGAIPNVLKLFKVVDPNLLPFMEYYIWIAIAVGFFGRRKAKKERSASKNLAS